jgi:hypothetical protein
LLLATLWQAVTRLVAQVPIKFTGSLHHGKVERSDGRVLDGFQVDDGHILISDIGWAR